MNRFYKISNLLDGNFDGLTIHSDRRRHYYNLFVQFITFMIFVCHSIVFMRPDLKEDIIYLCKINEGTGEYWTNFLLGVTAFAYSVPIAVHNKYRNDDFEMFGFLFCPNEKVMQMKYKLNERRAKNQMKIQRISIKIFYYWSVYSAVNVGFIVFKFAFTNPNYSKYSYYYLVLAIVLYLLLYFAETVAMLRTFLILCQFQFGALYLHNRLKTLTDEIDEISVSELNQKEANMFVEKILNAYNLILKNQRKLNHHCERNFFVYFLFTSFTIALPIVILFEKQKELIISNIFTYIVMFLNFSPPILFNMCFTRANMNFVRKCFWMSKQLKSPKYKLKIENTVLSMNQTSHSISFHFRHFMNFSLYLLVFWTIESLNISMLFYTTVKVGISDSEINSYRSNL